MSNNPQTIHNYKTKKDYEISSDLDLKNYLYETNQELLDESATAHDLLENNKNVMEYQQRARDEDIYNMVKRSVKSNKTWKHTFKLAHTWTTPSWRINNLNIVERKYNALNSKE